MPRSRRHVRPPPSRPAKPPEDEDILTVRPAQAGDIPAVAALDANITSLAKGTHWQEILDRSLAHGDTHFFLVACAPSGHVVGFIVGEIRAWEFGSAPCGWVYAMSVDPEAREFGVGETLLEAIEEDFRDAGVNKMRTMVAKQDTLPMRFFRAEGMMAGPYIQLEKDLG